MNVSFGPCDGGGDLCDVGRNLTGSTRQSLSLYYCREPRSVKRVNYNKTEKPAMAHSFGYSRALLPAVIGWTENKISPNPLFQYKNQFAMGAWVDSGRWVDMYRLVDIWPEIQIQNPWLLVVLIIIISECGRHLESSMTMFVILIYM